MFFNSVKEIRLKNEMNRLLSKGMWVFLMDVFKFNLRKNWLRKEINRLLSKEMSNIYLKVATEDKN